MPAPVKVVWNKRPIFRPPHQGEKSEASQPKYSYLPPQAGNPQGAWRTSGHFLDPRPSVSWQG